MQRRRTPRLWKLQRYALLAGSSGICPESIWVKGKRYVENFIKIILVAAMVYMVGTIVIGIILEYFAGDGNPVYNKMFAPLPATKWLAKNLVRWAIWPWRFRNERLFGEIYDIPVPDGEPDSESIQIVRDRLRELASNLGRYFGRQELLRHMPNADREDVKWIDRKVRLAKSDFWEARGLAKRFGFDVGSSYTDYLTT